MAGEFELPEIRDNGQTPETVEALLALLARFLDKGTVRKRWSESRLILGGALSVLAGVAVALGVVPDSALVDLTASQVEGIVGAILAIGGGLVTLLRLDTDSGIG